MLHRIVLFSTSVVLLLCLACAGVDVTRDYDADYDFSRLNSWNFLDVTPEQAGVDSLTLVRIHQAIGHELNAKGYQQTGKPDFGVAVRGGSQTRTDVEGYEYDWSERDSTNLKAFQYDVGSLTIDIVDIESQQTIWSGTGTAIIGKVDPKSATNRIRVAVEKMLSPFPPGK